MSRRRKRWDWTFYQSSLPKPSTSPIAPFELELSEEELHERGLLLLDDKAWLKYEGQVLLRKAAVSTRGSGKPDQIMSIWSDALQQSSERELRANDRAEGEVLDGE